MDNKNEAILAGHLTKEDEKIIRRIQQGLHTEKIVYLRYAIKKTNEGEEYESRQPWWTGTVYSEDFCKALIYDSRQAAEDDFKRAESHSYVSVEIVEI